MVLLGAALVVAGCAVGEDAPPPRADPTIATAVAPTHPLAVPEVVDEAYVNRLLAAYDQAIGEAFRVYVAAGGPTAEAEERVRAMVGDEDGLWMSVYGNFDVLFALLSMDEPGNPSNRVLELDVATPDCIHVKVLRHAAPQIGISGGDPFPTWMGLRRVGEPGSLGPYNPTGWMLVSGVDTEGNAPPGGPCLVP